MADLLSKDPRTIWRNLPPGRRAVFSLYVAANAFALDTAADRAYKPMHYAETAAMLHNCQGCPFDHNWGYTLEQLEKLPLPTLIDRVGELWHALSYVDRAKIATRYAKVFMG